MDSILAAGPAHHRLAWIHPFLDGNGRVARLMSHATFLEALDTVLFASVVAWPSAERGWQLQGVSCCQ